MRTAILSLGLLSLAGRLLGQATPRLEFEVASVKPADLPTGGFISLGPRTGPGTSDPSRVNYRLATLKGLLMTAYDVKTYQVIGPSWLDTERFDIVATVPPGATKEQVNIMLQNLLADRFKVTLHHETKELPLFELTVGKNGSKLKPFVADPSAPAPIQPGGPPPGPLGPPQIGKDGFPALSPGGMVVMMMPGRQRIKASKQTVSQLANSLSNQLGRTVVDKTGLIGEFDYTLEFSSEGLSGSGPFGGGLGGLPPPPPPGPPGGAAVPTPPGPTDNAEAPTLISAIQDQLGLKLEQKKGPLDLLVIDRAEKVPTAN